MCMMMIILLMMIIHMMMIMLVMIVMLIEWFHHISLDKVQHLFVPSDLKLLVAQRTEAIGSLARVIFLIESDTNLAKKLMPYVFVTNLATRCCHLQYL